MHVLHKSGELKAIFFILLLNVSIFHLVLPVLYISPNVNEFILLYN